MMLTKSEHTTAEHRRLIETWFQEHAKSLCLQEKPNALVLEKHDDKGNVVGLLTFGERHKVGHVNEVITAPKARHQGIGTELMERMEAEARKLGCESLLLSTWSHQARGFYEKQGFVVVGKTTPTQKGTQKFWMEKILI